MCFPRWRERQACTLHAQTPQGIHGTVHVLHDTPHWQSLSIDLDRQPVCRTIWNDIWSNKRREITHNVMKSNQNIESFKYCLLRALAMFDVLSCICRSIRHHFKCSVNTLIVHELRYRLHHAWQWLSIVQLCCQKDLLPYNYHNIWTIYFVEFLSVWN